MIAVHCGAGYHGSSKHSKYKRLCNKACRRGVSVLRKGGTALEAITAAIKVLEDDPLTNAGYGSNLTTSKLVECDAAVMDGSTLLYGGCGATTAIKNPIELACSLCLRQRHTSEFGLIPPSLLVGSGANEQAHKLGLLCVPNEDLVAPNALKQLRKYRKLTLIGNKDYNKGEERMDTVGAVCCDKNGNVAAACSSGGLLLKTPGRIGQGALYASGVWADSFDANGTSIAATTSGCGEHLMRTQLAKEICDDLKKSHFPIPDLSKCIKDKFLKSRFLSGIVGKDAGALVLHISPEGEGNVLWGHSTKSMSVGFMLLEDTKPKSLISALPVDSKEGESVMVGGSHFKLSNRPKKLDKKLCIL